MGSARLTDSGNLVDVEVTWSASSGDTTTQIYWTVHENGYGRTFCVKAKGGGNQINQGGTVTVGGTYYLQCFKNGSWYKDLGPFTITPDDSGGSGGSNTPTYTYKTNSISFSKTNFDLPSTGGKISYSRSTTGTGNKPKLYINGIHRATLGSLITSSSGTVEESFLTSTYSSYFTFGENTIKLEVAEHTDNTNYIITSFASATATVTIYNKPNVPIVSQSIVSSSSAGGYLGNNVSYDSNSILYYSDNNSNWYTYNTSIFFAKDTVYYFKAKHNITEEDSEILTIKPFVSNIAQAISFSNVVPSLETAQILLSSSIPYARKITATVSTDAEKYSWYFRASTTEKDLINSKEKLITESSKTEKTKELTINDSTLKMGYYYQIGVSGTDNLGDVSIITWYDQIYQIAPTPQIYAILNYFENEDFDTNLTEANRFYTDLTIYFNFNSEITKNNIGIQYKKADAQYWENANYLESNVNLGSITSLSFVKIKLPSDLLSDQEYNFRMVYKLYNNEIYSELIDNMYQINKTGIINNLSIVGGQETFKPYTEEGILQLKMAKPYENSFKENYTSANKFQCQIIVEETTVLLDLKENGFVEDAIENTVSFSYDKAQLYNKLESIGLNKSTYYKATLKLAVNNVFKIPHSANLPIIIDYRESPIITFNIPEKDGSKLNSSSIIKENDEIKFTCQISDYNAEIVQLRLQVNRSDTTTPTDQWVDYGEEISRTLSAGSYKNPSITPLIEITQKILEITQPKYISFRLKIKDSSGEWYSDYYSCGRSLQHTTPIIQQLNVTYKEDGVTTRSTNSIISGQLSLIDLGVGLKDVNSLDLIDKENSYLIFGYSFSEDATDYIFIQDSQQSLTTLIDNYKLGKLTNFTIPFNFEESSNYTTLQLQIFTIINYQINGETLSSSKTFYLSPFVVFNTLQTVSYRKNRLAINTRDFDTNSEYQNAILVIGQADSNRNQIIYSSPSGSGYLVNFIIDGGEW